MKVTLDLTRLLQQGQITPEEFAKLSRLAASDTGSLALSLLIGFGVIAVGGAVLALVPSATTAAGLGAAVLAGGLLLLVRHPAWLLLANMCVLVGALTLGGAVVLLAEASPTGFLLIAALFAVAGVAARSGLLVALAVLALGGAVGGFGGYTHAEYTLIVSQPTLTVALFAILAAATLWASRRLPHEGERLALIASRTAVILVNFGFWVGSLWGDDLGRPRPSTDRTGGIHIPEAAFAVAWAVALVVVGAWAARENRRWVLNVVAVFGAIHFYTQWFERLGATPLAVLMAGLVTLAAAYALWRWNNRDAGPPARDQAA